MGQSFREQMDNDSKHTEKAAQVFSKARKKNICQWLGHLIPKITKDKTDIKVHKQKATEDD